MPTNQRCKLSFIKNNDVIDVIGSANYLLIGFDYLMDHEVMAVFSSKNNIISICL